MSIAVQAFFSSIGSITDQNGDEQMISDENKLNQQIMYEYAVSKNFSQIWNASGSKGEIILFIIKNEFVAENKFNETWSNISFKAINGISTGFILNADLKYIGMNENKILIPFWYYVNEFERDGWFLETGIGKNFTNISYLKACIENSNAIKSHPFVVINDFDSNGYIDYEFLVKNDRSEVKILIFMCNENDTVRREFDIEYNEFGSHMYYVNKEIHYSNCSSNENKYMWSDLQDNFVVID